MKQKKKLISMNEKPEQLTIMKTLSNLKIY